MSQYQQFDVEDFATDEYFRKWVFEPDVQTMVFWEDWLYENPHRAETVQKAKHLLLALQSDVQVLPDHTVRRLWHHIDSQTSEDRTLQVQSFLESPRIGRWNRTYQIAATWSLLLIAGAVLFYWLRKSPEVSYATTYGEIKKIQLPDGSEVVLNANSGLSFKNDWEEKQLREVYLQGEAYFKVKEMDALSSGKKAKVKFVVITSDMRIEVLGTQFNVTNRRNNTAVVLRSGKVKLALQGAETESEVLMKPGDLVSYSSEQKFLRKQIVNPDQYDTWKEKRWVFKGVTLAEIANRLEETYGVQVRWENESLKNRTVSGAIPTENIDIVLQALSVSLNLNIVKEQNQIVMKE